MTKCRLIHTQLSENVFIKRKLYFEKNIHGMIWELWNGKTLKDGRPFIYRIVDNNLMILCNNEYPIETTDLEWMNGHRMSEREINFNGMYSYEIKVNPIIKKDNEMDSSKRKAVPLKNDNDVKKWWEKKGQNYGFKIVNNLFSVTNKSQSVIDPNRSIILYRVTISGVLEVTNPDVFNKRFVKGFGGKGNYGCGLMMLKGKYN